MNDGFRIYNLFPPLAGTIRDWMVHLPRIAAMGFNAVYLNPFHYPGFSGSLYAVKDYYRLNPRLRGGERGEDDALLRLFTDAARAHGLRVIMDLVVNHTSRDSELVASHPGWFTRDSSGDVVSPHAIDPADSRRMTRSGIRSSPIFSSWCGIMCPLGSAVSAATPLTRCLPRSGAL